MTFLGATVVDRLEILDAVALPNGTTIGVEVVRRGGAGDISANRAFDFDEVGAALSGLAQVVRDAMVRVAPDTASVEFGMDLKVEAGKLTALLVSGSGSASLKVTLGWEADKTQGSPST